MATNQLNNPFQDTEQNPKPSVDTVVTDGDFGHDVHISIILLFAEKVNRNLSRLSKR